MKIINVKSLVLVLLFFTSAGIFSQEQEVIYTQKAKEQMNQKPITMKTYVIEREISEAGKLSEEQLQGIAQKSNEIITDMGLGIEWVHSYITENKVYCVYNAQSEEAIKEHAKKGGFPVNKISELSTTINPETAKN